MAFWPCLGYVLEKNFALVTFCDIQVMFWLRIFRNFLLFDLLDTPLVWFS